VLPSGSAALLEYPAIGVEPINRVFHRFSDPTLWLPTETAYAGGIKVNQGIVADPSLPSARKA